MAEMTPELRAALDEHGFGDLDPVTGPDNNPEFINQWWAVDQFLKAADAYERPWVDQPFVTAAVADPRLAPQKPRRRTS